MAVQSLPGLVAPAAGMGHARLERHGLLHLRVVPVDVLGGGDGATEVLRGAAVRLRDGVRDALFGGDDVGVHGACGGDGLPHVGVLVVVQAQALRLPLNEMK